MKKILIIAAMMATALTASATRVSWGVTAGQALNDTYITSGTMYLIQGTMDWSLFDTMSSFNEESLTTAGATKIVDTFDYSSATVNKTSTITPSTLGASGTQSFYVVCIGETLADGSQYIAYSPTAQTASITTSTMTLPKTQVSSAFSYTAASVPEPTSGLLLLIGMAGLALKRKHA